MKPEYGKQLARIHKKLSSNDTSSTEMSHKMLKNLIKHKKKTPRNNNGQVQKPGITYIQTERRKGITRRMNRGSKIIG